MTIHKFSTHGPRIFCFASLLSSSSISTSSSRREFSSTIDNGLGQLGSLNVPFAHGNSYSHVTNTSWILNLLT